MENNSNQVKRGARFLHAQWLDPSTMGSNPKPQLRQVTAIRGGCVYYRPVYRHGDREDLGTAMHEYQSCFDGRVKEWI